MTEMLDLADKREGQKKISHNIDSKPQLLPSGPTSLLALRLCFLGIL